MKYTFLVIALMLAFAPFIGVGQEVDSLNNRIEIYRKLSDKYTCDMGNRSAEYQDKIRVSADSYFGFLSFHTVGFVPSFQRDHLPG